MFGRRVVNQVIARGIPSVRSTIKCTPVATFKPQISVSAKSYSFIVQNNNIPSIPSAA